MKYIALIIIAVLISLPFKAKADSLCDLTIKQLSVAYACSVNLCAFAFSAAVKNIGTGVCPASTTMIVADGRTGYYQTHSLNPLEGQIVTTQYRTPIVNGFYTVQATANYDLGIEESDYRNNFMEGVVEVNH